MNIFQEIRDLNLPKGEYAVFGSGILGALGIREIGDIDLLVSPKLFDELQQRGWQYSEVEIEGRMRKKLTQGIVEAFKDFWYGDKNPDVLEMISHAELVQDIPFVTLQELLEIKHSFNREKDHTDIALINEFLANRNMFRRQLDAEGFKHIYEWTDEPNTKYSVHAHKGRVAFYILAGSITMNLENETKLLSKGDYIDVPVGLAHTAKVGSLGCTFVVGEMIKGDS